MYINWQEMSSTSPAVSFLWMQGNLGSGKIVLVWQRVQDISSLGGTVVLYVFCKVGQENQDILESVLLFNSIGNIPRHVYLPVEIHCIYKRPEGI